MSHTRSQLLQVFMPQPPQELSNIKSNTMSQVLQPHPFAPFVKNPFMLCTPFFVLGLLLHYLTLS